MAGFSGVHQFCKVGAHAFLANNAAVTRDVPPYVMVVGQPAAAHSVNAEGLKRRGFTPEQIRNLNNAYRLLYRSGLKLAEATAQLAGARGRSSRSCAPSSSSCALHAQHRALTAAEALVAVAGSGPAFGLVAGEASGDNLGAAADRARCRTRAPGSRFFGVAGPRMTAAGCEAWTPSEALAVMGLSEIAAAPAAAAAAAARPAAAPRRGAARTSSSASMRRSSTCASRPTLQAPRHPHGAVREPAGLGLAAGPRAHAWRSAVDLVLCLLPFETRVLRRRTTCAPCSSAIRSPTRFPLAPDRAAARAALGLPAGGRSSRCCRAAARRGDAARSRLSPAPLAWLPRAVRTSVRRADGRCRRARSAFERALARHAPGVTGAARWTATRRLALAAADVVLVASGTATLETAAVKRPDGRRLPPRAAHGAGCCATSGS